MMHDYVVMKLINGETIICVVVVEDDDYYTIMFPVQMKPTKLDNGSKKEVQVGVPWLPYTDDKIIEINKHDILLVKPLNPTTIAYYKNLVDMNEVEEEVEVIISSFQTNPTIVKGNNTIH